MALPFVFILIAGTINLLRGVYIELMIRKKRLIKTENNLYNAPMKSSKFPTERSSHSGSRWHCWIDARYWMTELGQKKL
ncbi:MAG: hypothetical protein Ct9H300mP3_11130 [Gammaproteobacteria bacterium]|nr:MAG: hypothetical protein Ct9H300mP3_11130 [Gammaproteobacteria bacterium]